MNDDRLLPLSILSTIKNLILMVSSLNLLGRKLKKANVEVAIDLSFAKYICSPFCFYFWPFCGRVDRGSATDAVDSGSIPGWVKLKTIKIGIHSFLG